MRHQQAQFFRQLSLLTSSGVPLLRALEDCRWGLCKGRLERSIVDAMDEIRRGTRLSRALLEVGRPFTPIHGAILAAGESSGRLDRALEELATREESSARLQRRVQAALLYPCFVLLVSLLGLFLLLRFLLPVLSGLSQQAGGTPARTLTMLAQLAAYSQRPELWLGLGLAAVALAWIVRRPWAHKLLQRLAWRIPIVRLQAQVILCRTLASLLSAGLPLVDTVQLACQCTGNAVLSDVLTRALDHVRCGESLAQSLTDSRILPASFRGILTVGEKSGRLEFILGKLAQLYEWELDSAIETFVKSLEPLTVALVGGAVMGLMVCTFNPLYDILRQI